MIFVFVWLISLSMITSRSIDVAANGIVSFMAAAAAAKSLQSCPIPWDPHRWQPTRLPRPWDSPGKNTGVGFHFLLQCMKVKSEREVAQSCPILCDPMDCSPPGSSIHGIFQARVHLWLSNILLCMCVCIYIYIYTMPFSPFTCWWTFKLLPCLGYCE